MFYYVADERGRKVYVVVAVSDPNDFVSVSRAKEYATDWAGRLARKYKTDMVVSAASGAELRDAYNAAKQSEHIAA